MLSIDEAIVNEKEMAEGLREQYECMMECSDIFREQKKVFIEQCKYDAEYHEQLAEWLEELKAYREIGTVEECRNSILEIPKAYNKALDDAKSVILQTLDNEILVDTLHLRLEQLKERNKEQRSE